MAQQEALKEEHARVRQWAAVDERGSHKSSERIEQEIDATRYDMDRTMNEIGRRFHPRNFFDHLLDYFHDRRNRERLGHAVQEVGHSALETMQHNPGALLLIGGGVAWMLASERRGQEGRHVYGVAGHYVDARTGEPYPTERETGKSIYHGEEIATGSKGGDKAKEKGAQVAGAARKAFGKAGERAHGQAQRIRHSARHGLSSTRGAAGRQLSQSADRLGALMREYPFAVGLGALALGVLAGGIVPGTRPEQQAMGESSEEVRHKAEEKVHQAQEAAATAI
jgi:hypothetical protein